MSIYSAEPCSRLADDPEPGVRLNRLGELLNRLTIAEAKELGADLIIAAQSSEGQWDAPGPRAREEAR